MPYTLAAVALTIVWGIAVVRFDAPGWIHLLLSAGVALWVYGIVRPKPAEKR